MNRLFLLSGHCIIQTTTSISVSLIKRLANTAETVGLDCAIDFAIGFRDLVHKNSFDLRFVCTLNTRYILTCIWKIYFPDGWLISRTIVLESIKSIVSNDLIQGTRNVFIECRETAETNDKNFSHNLHYGPFCRADRNFTFIWIAQSYENQIRPIWFSFPNVVNLNW